MRLLQRMKRHIGGYPLMTALLTTVATLSMAASAAAQGEETAVTCFQGNPAEGKSVGTINVTFLQNAAMTCNSTFYELCLGKCVACYTDAGSDKVVCIDSAGTKIVK